MKMAGALSVTLTAICMYVTHNDVRSLSQIVLSRILWNLVTLFSTIMSSSSSMMVHIASCLQELWPFVYKNWPVKLSALYVEYFWSEFYETLSHCLVPNCLLYVRWWFISHHAFRRYGLLFINIHCLKQCLLSKLNSLDKNFMKLGHMVSTIMSSSSFIMVHIAPCFLELLPFVNENSPFLMVSGLAVIQ